MTKVEEKLKAGRVKRPEGSGFSEEQQKKHAGTRSNPTKKYLAKLIVVNIDFLICELLEHYSSHKLFQHFNV